MLLGNVAPVIGRTASRLKGASTRYASPEGLAEFFEALRPTDRPLATHKRFSTKCKTDVYSFGVMMWELMERKVPYGDIHENLVADLVMSGKYGPLKFGTRVDEEYLFLWREVAISCWARDPERRPSFTELLKTLDEILRSKILTRA